MKNPTTALDLKKTVLVNVAEKSRLISWETLWSKPQLLFTLPLGVAYVYSNKWEEICGQSYTVSHNEASSDLMQLHELIPQFLRYPSEIPQRSFSLQKSINLSETPISDHNRI